MVVKLPTIKGTKFSEEHRRALSEARRKSPHVKAAAARLSTLFKGKAPVPEAIAGTMATRALSRLGLSRDDFPELWESYRDTFLEQRRQKALPTDDIGY